MSMYQVSYNATTRVALVQADAAAVPGGSVDVGSFEHPDDTYPDSKVIYHAVRDLLYKRSAANPAVTAVHPYNIMDMQNISIMYASGIVAGDFVVINTISLAPSAAAIAVAGTVQLVLTLSPSNATSEGVVYSTSDAGIATVNTTGLVTGVAAGTATITATDETATVTDTSVITVS